MNHFLKFGLIDPRQSEAILFGNFILIGVGFLLILPMHALARLPLMQNVVVTFPAAVMVAALTFVLTFLEHLIILAVMEKRRPA